MHKAMNLFKCNILSPFQLYSNLLMIMRIDETCSRLLVNNQLETLISFVEKDLQLI